MSGASPRSPLRRLRHVAGALVAVVALAALLPGPVAAGPQETKRQIERARDRLKELRRDIEDARAVLDGLRGEIDSITTQLTQLTNQILGLRLTIEDTKKGIQRRGRRVDGLQSQIDARARSAYMAGPGGAVELILGAESLVDLSDRLTFLEVLNQHDADVATGLQVEREQLRRQKVDLERYEAELEQQLALSQEQHEILQVKFAEQQTLAGSIARKLDDTSALIEELQKKYQRELAAALAAQRAAAAPIVGNVGPLPSADGPFYACPVDPPRSYIDDFGFPRVGHTHQGNDIFAPEGTPIRAPFAGTAEESYNSLGGTSVHVYSSNGSGDYVYNAHLSRHAGVDGQQVRPGDLIGYVGNTGNAVGTSPHDHFEYHPGGGSAVSPYVYLNEVCGVGGSG